jgi:hypothetical protein
VAYGTAVGAWRTKPLPYKAPVLRVKSNIQIGRTIPLALNVAHDECVVKLDAPLRKVAFITKIA